ncbi:MAG: hypothetical protein HY886_07090 [Deltaproteobacteria bacterium]|nr:hypothetical protein [Deltaproteobacteria bacterium]
MKTKKCVVVFLLLVVALIIAPLSARAEFKKTKIAVLDFALQGEGFETQDMGKIVAEWIVTGLVQAGRFNVVERGLLQKILKEQELPMYGVVDAKNAAKTGMIVGAKIVITGSVMRLKDYMEVSARIIDVEDGSIIAAEKVKTDRTGRLEDLVSQMVTKIILDFPLEGYVVERSDKNAIVDLGRNSGAKSGKRFIVYKEGKVIKHPKTGEVLDVEKIETGEIEIRDVKEKTASAIILRETSPYKVERGNLVRSLIEKEASAPDTTVGRDDHFDDSGFDTAGAMKTIGSFNAGDTYYVATTLHAGGRKSVISWENRTDLSAIPAGEKVVITTITPKLIKFKWSGREYIFIYHQSKKPNHAMLLSKFFSTENPLSGTDGYPPEVKLAISQGQLTIGMTKRQAIFSKGVPYKAGGRKTVDMGLDEILKTTKWEFSQGKFDTLQVYFAGDKIIKIED